MLTSLPVSLVGAHLSAAVLGLYTSAPDVTIVQTARAATGGEAMVIEVRADDGRLGSGVRQVEFQVGSTSGTWMPLSLDSSSMTYKGTWRPEAVTEGNHELYVRATDNTGNPRTVHVTVSVSPAPSGVSAG
ncbi:hypothetical protein JRI60_31665 [Archangium violaceum]|uniref:Ig-like domain-containing protein n=1 Tax=Archangium violaceum TaxID=83451 RepID=UPI001950A528|nr:Ig-like domain-containing protein [Archangium violaceum]QRN93716.1 hypothetical protein JRI60_31665 [Archangium violaceum]